MPHIPLNKIFFLNYFFSNYFFTNKPWNTIYKNMKLRPCYLQQPEFYHILYHLPAPGLPGFKLLSEQCYTPLPPPIMDF